MLIVYAGKHVLKHIKKYTSKCFTKVKIVYIRKIFMNKDTTKIRLQAVNKSIST